MNIVDKMKSQIGDDPQYIFDHEALFKLAIVEIVRLREIIKLASDQDQGCGGGLPPENILRSMQVILRQEMAAQKDPSDGE